MAPYNKLADKHVLVIGGSKGIGRAVAEAALASGARVTITGSTPQSAEEALSAIRASFSSSSSSSPSSSSQPISLRALAADLASGDTIEADLTSLFATAADLHGQIDHVVSTAGDALTIKPLDDVTPELALGAAHFRFVLPLMLGKVAGRYFRDIGGEGSEGGGDRSLTLTTGGIADHPSKDWSLMAYFCAGIYALTANLALDLTPQRVRVNCVSPGAVQTGLWDPMYQDPAAREAAMEDAFKHLPAGGIGRAEDVAEAYVYLLRDRNATGEIVRTRGGGQLL